MVYIYLHSCKPGSLALYYYDHLLKKNAFILVPFPPPGQLLFWIAFLITFLKKKAFCFPNFNFWSLQAESRQLRRVRVKPWVILNSRLDLLSLYMIYCHCTAITWCRRNEMTGNNITGFWKHSFIFVPTLNNLATWCKLQEGWDNLVRTPNQMALLEENFRTESTFFVNFWFVDYLEIHGL